MQIKTNPDEIESFLSDASFIREGHADRVVLPESIEDISQFLASANRERVPVTVSGAGTGTVGGRVAFGGIVLATDKLNRIRQIVHEGSGGFAVVEPGVVLADLQRAVDQEGLLYPPDPTERDAQECYRLFRGAGDGRGRSLYWQRGHAGRHRRSGSKTVAKAGRSAE